MINIEEEIIIAMIHSTEWRKRFLSKVDPSVFELDFSKWIFAEMSSIPDETLDQESLGVIVSRLESSDIERAELFTRHIAKALSKIAKRQKEGAAVIYPQLALSDIERLAKKQRIKSIAMTIAQGINEGQDDEKIFKEIADHVAQAKDSNSDDYEITDFLTPEGVEKRSERNKEIEATGKKFKFKNPIMNKHMKHGIRQSEIFLICGDTNAKKSMTATNFAAEAIQPHNNLNTVYFYTEMEAQQQEARTEAIINEVHYDKVFTGSLGEKELEMIKRHYANVVNQNLARLFTVKVIPYGFNIWTIEAAVEEIEQKYNLTIDCIFIDSPEHQQPLVQHKQFFQNKAGVYYDIKAYTALTKKIMFCTIQRKIDSALKKAPPGKRATLVRPSPEEAAGSAEIPRIVDNMLMLIRPSPSDQLLDRNKAWFVKFRNHAIPDNPIFITMDTNTLRMSFSDYEESTEMEDDEMDDAMKRASQSVGKTVKMKITNHGGEAVDEA